MWRCTSGPCASSRELVFISLYLTLGSVILMKTAILHTEDIAFTPWGIAVVKAVMLAKFMLLGNAMKLGERATARPLIWPTLEKAFALLVLLTIVTATRRRPVPPLVDRCLARTLWISGPWLQETIAGFIIMLLMLIPYSAFMVLNQVSDTAMALRRVRSG
jgi:hypothetical protein